MNRRVNVVLDGQELLTVPRSLYKTHQGVIEEWREGGVLEQLVHGLWVEVKLGQLSTNIRIKP